MRSARSIASISLPNLGFHRWRLGALPKRTENPPGELQAGHGIVPAVIDMRAIIVWVFNALCCLNPFCQISKFLIPPHSLPDMRITFNNLSEQRF